MPIPSDLADLLDVAAAQPSRFQPTAYWEVYQERLRHCIPALDLNDLRCGRYPLLNAFGFGDPVFQRHGIRPAWKRMLVGILQEHLLGHRRLLPFGTSVATLQALAYRHAHLEGQLAGAKPLAAVGVDPWGSPPDLFTHGECNYTIAFLTAYLRYAFVHAHRPFTETMRVVELGSGAGTQAELLHKLYPRATILCFDLPLQGWLCQHHLRRVFGSSAIVPMEETVSWQDLSRVEPGRITVLPNWKMPLLADWPHDLFWNAASFGEMEPEVVSSYMRDFAAAPAAVYLQQAVGGKETTGSHRVRIPIMEADYDGWMPHHRRLARTEAWGPLVPVGSGDPYFQALWVRLTAS